MIKIIIVLVATAVALGQEFEIIDNMVDFAEEPYQGISLPYPYQEGRNSRVVQSEPNQNDVNVNEGLELLELTTLKSIQEVNTSLSTRDSSLISTLWSVAFKFIGLVRPALSKLVLNIRALSLGAILLIGFCKITSICTNISSIQSLSEAQQVFNTVVTPERLDMVLEFIQEAIRRYRSIQS